MDWHAAGRNGVVAAGGEEAVEAGIALLSSGGNAVDGAVAALLALSVTDYGSFAIGGEIPMMVYEAGAGRVKVLSGVGGAPRSPEAIEWYYDNGIPGEGGMRASPVPGAPDLCLTALRLFGTVSFEEAVSPTLRLLGRGEASWHGSLAETFRRLIEAEHRCSGGRERKLEAARNRFYKGDVAEALEDFYVERGGFLRRSDLAAHVTRVEDPVSVRYRGYTVHKCGPWTQGPCLCQVLRLLEGFDLEGLGHLSADYVHLVVEALKLALADRDEYYGDPLLVEVPMDALLADEYTDLRRALIDRSRASVEFRPGDPLALRAVKPGGSVSGGDVGTTTCVVADGSGNVVAATPSANGPYAVCEQLGIAHGNRLRSLNTTPAHPNRIEPGKRPRITLTPTLVTKDGRAVLAISVAGGDLQDQTTLNCLLNYIEFGMPPRQAVTAPRFSTGHHQDSFRPDADRRHARVAPGVVTLDPRIDDPVGRELEERGHSVERTPEPIATPVMLHRDPGTGLAQAAGDPRAGRHAAALK